MTPGFGVDRDELCHRLSVFGNNNLFARVINLVHQLQTDRLEFSCCDDHSPSRYDHSNMREQPIYQGTFT